MDLRLLVAITCAAFCAFMPINQIQVADAAASSPSADTARVSSGGQTNPASGGESNSNAGASAAEASSEKKGSKPVLYSQLALVAVPGNKVQYSLQVGMFQNQDSLAKLKNLLVENGYETQEIEVEDSGKVKWFVLAAGNYQSLEEAQTGHYNLAARLELNSRIIILPQEKK